MNKINLAKGKGYYEFLANLNYKVFSDTIVITVDLKDEIDEFVKHKMRFFSMSYAAILANEMFHNGLAIRGALHEGQYISESNCLAGKGVIESYRLCELLNFSGVVCSPYLEKILTGKKLLPNLKESQKKLSIISRGC